MNGVLGLGHQSRNDEIEKVEIHKAFFGKSANRENEIILGKYFIFHMATIY